MRPLDSAKFLRSGPEAVRHRDVQDSREFLNWALFEAFATYRSTLPKFGVASGRFLGGFWGLAFERFTTNYFSSLMRSPAQRSIRRPASAGLGDIHWRFALFVPWFDKPSICGSFALPTFRFDLSDFVESGLADFAVDRWALVSPCDVD